MLIRIIGYLHNKRQRTAFQACQQNNRKINVTDIIDLDFQSVCKAMKKL